MKIENLPIELEQLLQAAKENKEVEIIKTFDECFYKLRHSTGMITFMIIHFTPKGEKLTKLKVWNEYFHGEKWLKKAVKKLEPYYRD